MLKKFSYLLFIPLLFFACKKEKFESEAERTQHELERVIKEKSIEQVYFYDAPNMPAGSSKFWEFSNGYIIFNDGTTPYGRNLATLSHYDVGNTGTADAPIKGLRLFFK